MNLVDFYAKELNTIFTDSYTVKHLYYEIQTCITDAEVKRWDLKIAVLWYSSNPTAIFLDLSKYWESSVHWICVWRGCTAFLACSEHSLMAYFIFQGATICMQVFCSPNFPVLWSQNKWASLYSCLPVSIQQMYITGNVTVFAEEKI